MHIGNNTMIQYLQSFDVFHDRNCFASQNTTICKSSQMVCYTNCHLHTYTLQWPSPPLIQKELREAFLRPHALFLQCTSLSQRHGWPRPIHRLAKLTSCAADGEVLADHASEWNLDSWTCYGRSTYLSLQPVTMGHQDVATALKIHLTDTSLWACIV